MSEQQSRRVFLDIGFNELPIGRVVFELYFGCAPKACANFTRLCSATHTTAAKTFSLKQSKLHRIVPGFVIQGGDITKGDGTGGHSAYSTKTTDIDQPGHVKHDGPFVLSMADSSSQFFITLGEASFLDAKHTAFGSVVEGFSVVRKIEQAGSASGKPSKRVSVLECGVLEDDADVDGGGGLVTEGKDELPERVDATGEAVHESSLRRLHDTIGLSEFGKEQTFQQDFAQQDQQDEQENDQQHNEKAEIGEVQHNQEQEGQEDEADDLPPGEWESMSSQQKKLMQLRRRLNQSRKANQREVVGERKRQAGGSTKQTQHERDEEAKPGWKKQWEEDAHIMGLDQSKPHLLESQESAEARHKRKQSAKMHDTSAHAPENAYREYNNRSGDIDLSPEIVQKKKEVEPMMNEENNMLEYGEHMRDDPDRVDALLNELGKKQRKAQAQLRKRVRRSKEADAVNLDNDAFNKNVDKSFDKHTTEIKQNLERGTALPDH
jgi:cyclophilin family peptidyl-prolyl cis-trans isomerase